MVAWFAALALGVTLLGEVDALSSAQQRGSNNKQSGTIYTGVSVIGDGQGGFPAGWLDTADLFGNAVGPLGDVNNDNITDFVVGTPSDDDAGNDAGAVYVLQMTAQKTTVDRAFKITEGLRGFAGGIGAGDRFGWSADGIGDVDGNGVGDIAVGAVWDDDAADFAGAVYVLLMEANVQVNATVKITTGQGGFTHALGFADFFGHGLAGVGDVDGNGVPDVAVGADGDDTGSPDVGAVYVLLMLATGRVSSSTKITSATGGFSFTLRWGDHFGSHVAALGDMNGDGVPDIGVGAFGCDRGGQSDAGCMHILHLAPNGTVGTLGTEVPGPSGFEQFGSACRVGDVDGDGIDDLAVGAWDANAVYVMLMGDGGLVREYHKITGVDGQPRHFGAAVSFVERGTGVSLLVGAPGNNGVFVLDLLDRFTTWPSVSPSSSPSAAPSPAATSPTPFATPFTAVSSSPSGAASPSTTSKAFGLVPALWAVVVGTLVLLG